MSSGSIESADAALFEALRAMWVEQDPVPSELVDRMVVAVAMCDLDHDWQLLSVLESATVSAVRGPAATAECRGAEVSTVQLGDGATTVLLHFSDTEDRQRRVDGWVDAPVLAVSLMVGNKEHPGTLIGSGRFAIDAAPHGSASLRLVIRDGDGMRKLFTPEIVL